MTESCVKCGSNKIIPAAQIFDQGQGSGGHLQARVDTKPEKILFKGTVLSRLQARICGSCGFTEIYASQPESLYQAHLELERQV